MKISSTRSVVFLLFVFLGACQGGGQQETSNDPPAGTEKFSPAQLDMQKNSWDQVMTIHDEVMPRMGDINRINRSLKDLLEKEGALDDIQRDRAIAAVEALDQAEEGMWDWMHELRQLDALRAGETHEAILSYLAQEKDLITKIRDNMLKSIETGSKLLEELNSK